MGEAILVSKAQYQLRPMRRSSAACLRPKTTFDDDEGYCTLARSPQATTWLYEV
jgi:hypothetical protein